MKKAEPPVQARVNYLRVSDDEKQYPERSFDSQRQVITDVLDPLVNLPVSHEYRDIERGSKTDRVQYQRMLADARAGLISDICVYRIDRFGREPAEAFAAANLFMSLGVRIWASDMPGMKLGTPSGNLQFGLQTVLAKYEIDVLSQRVRDTKRKMMMQGKWPNHPPDGYVARREETGPRKYHCWIEQHPVQARMVRDAYDLWLPGGLTLLEVCEELHRRGYTRGSGKPWVWDDPNTGGRRYAYSHIQRILTNPFHAGWLISKRHGITRGQVRGEWESLVSDEELDRSIAILREHDRNKSREKRNKYLLRGVLHLEYEGKRYRLYGSTPTGRSRRYSYYETKAQCGGMRRRVRVDQIDPEIPAWLQHIVISPGKLAQIRRLYRQHIDTLNTPDRKRLLEKLEARIKAMESQEADLGRLLLTGKIGEDAYDQLRAEWNEKLVAARLEYNTLSKEAVDYEDDLELALKVLAQACWIFERLSPRDQTKFIRLIVRKLVIDLEGRIVAWELNAPFEYLSRLASGTVLYQPDAEAPFAPPMTVEKFSTAARFEQRDKLLSLPEGVVGVS